jgi:hypothetical protein
MIRDNVGAAVQVLAPPAGLTGQEFPLLIGDFHGNSLGVSAPPGRLSRGVLWADDAHVTVNGNRGPEWLRDLLEPL